MCCLYCITSLIIHFVCFLFIFRHVGLWDILSSKHSVLLYPSQRAINIVDLPKEIELFNLVILDGTWPQAKAIYNNTQLLQSMIHVSIHCIIFKTYYKHLNLSLLQKH